MLADRKCGEIRKDLEKKTDKAEVKMSEQAAHIRSTEEIKTRGGGVCVHTHIHTASTCMHTV